MTCLTVLTAAISDICRTLLEKVSTHTMNYASDLISYTFNIQARGEKNKSKQQKKPDQMKSQVFPNVAFRAYTTRGTLLQFCRAKRIPQRGGVGGGGWR